MAAIAQGSNAAPRRTGRPKSHTVGLLAQILAPLLLIILPRRAKQRFKARLEHSREARKKAAQFRQDVEQLRREARLYRQIIVERLAFMGFSWRAGRGGDVSDEKARKRRKVIKVKIEFTRYQQHAIWFKIKVRSRGLFKAKNDLPYRTYVSELIDDKTLFELSMATQRRVKAKRDDPTRGAWFIVYRNDVGGLLPTKVHYHQVLEAYPLQDARKLPFVLGVGENNAVYHASFYEFTHILIAGGTNAGKSNLLNCILSDLHRFSEPGTTKFLLIDPKRVELAFYKRSPYLYAPVVYEIEQAKEAISDLVEEMKARAEQLEIAGVKNLTEWNALHPDNPLFRIVLVIEEMAFLWKTGTEARAIKDQLESIGHVGRFVGIHLLLCTQIPMKKVIPTEVKGNLYLRISGKVGSTVESVIILGRGDAARLPTIPGRMLFRQNSDLLEIQTPLITNEDVLHSVAIARGRAAGLIKLQGKHLALVTEAILAEIVSKTDGLLDARTLAEEFGSFGVSRGMLQALIDDLIRSNQIGAYRIEKRGRQYFVAAQEKVREDVIVEDPVPTPEPPKRRAILKSLPNPPRLSFAPLPAPPQVLLLPAITETAKMLEAAQPVAPEPEPEPELTNMDIFALFREECIRPQPGHWVPFEAVYKAYQHWCDEHGYKVPTKVMVGILCERAGLEKRRRGPQGSKGLYGISLTTDQPDTVSKKEA